MSKVNFESRIMHIHHYSIRRFGLVLSIIACCFLQNSLGPRELKAQRIIVRMGGGIGGKIELHNQLESIYASARNAARNRINSQLHDIDEACDLSAKQLERLKGAGKGAVEAHANKVLKELKGQAKLSGLDFIPGSPPEKSEDEEEPGDGIRQAARILNLNLGNGLNGNAKYMVDSQKIWTNTISKSLNSDQLKKLTSRLVEREDRIREAAVDHFIAKVDRKIFLSREQREKLKAFVNKKYGVPLAQKIDAAPVNNQRFVFAGKIQVDRNIEVSEAVKEILYEPQLELWKTEFQKDLNSLDKLGDRLGILNFLDR